MICTKCKTDKLTTEFYFNKSTNRPKTICKVCAKSYYKKAAIWKKNNVERVKKRVKEYSLKNKELLKKKRQARRPEENLKNREKYKNNINFKLSVILRSRLRIALKTNKKLLPMNEYLGCSIKELKNYLESKFHLGMTWDNWGMEEGCWSIDHIIPLSKVDLLNAEEFKKVNHYTNLQPMWHSNNLIKGNRI